MALDESFETIQEILEHVCNNMVAENAVAFVTVSPADQTPAKLMSQAVEERLSRFNQMTLHTIHSLLASPTVKQNPQTEVLLEMMKKEILKQAGHALPVELQTLDRLIKEKDDNTRAEVINVRPHTTPCATCGCATVCTANICTASVTAPHACLQTKKKQCCTE